MKAKYFVNLDNGFYSPFNDREGGAYREKVPNLLGEFVVFPANYHELGSVIELDLKGKTVEELADLRNYEYQGVLVRLENKYNRNFTVQDKKGNFELNIPTSQSLNEIVEFYNQFSKDEDRKAFYNKTKAVSKKK